MGERRVDGDPKDDIQRKGQAERQPHVEARCRFRDGVAQRCGNGDVRSTRRQHHKQHRLTRWQADRQGNRQRNQRVDWWGGKCVDKGLHR